MKHSPRYRQKTATKVAASMETEKIGSATAAAKAPQPTTADRMRSDQKIVRLTLCRSRTSGFTTASSISGCSENDLGSSTGNALNIELLRGRCLASDPGCRSMQASDN